MPFAESKPWHESKTIRTAILFLLIVVALIFAGREFVADHPIVVLLLAAAREVFAMVLRFATDGSVYLKE